MTRKEKAIIIDELTGKLSDYVLLPQRIVAVTRPRVFRGMIRHVAGPDWIEFDIAHAGQKVSL